MSEGKIERSPVGHNAGRFLTGLILIGLLIGAMSPTLAQQGSVTPHPGWYTCVDMTPSRANGYAEIHFDVDNSVGAMENLRVEAEGGGIHILGVDPQVGPGQPVQTGTYTIFIQVEELNLCRGRLRILWDERECLGFDETIDVFKQFTLEEVNDISRNLYGMEARIVGPTCITPGEPVTFSIHPYVSNCSWLVGQDHYEWILPQDWTFQYNSGDSSSITAIPPPDMGIGQVEVSVAIGTRCNGSNNILTLPVQMSLVGFHITSNLNDLGGLHGQAPISTLQDLNQGSVPSHASSQIVLTAVRPGGAGSLGVEWDNIPAGFTLVSGTLTSPSITVQASAPGARATFTARLPQASGECGRAVASYRINRGVSLQPTGTSAVPFNRIRFESYRGDDLIMTDDRGCFDSTYINDPGVKGKVTISLTNPSTSQPYVWNSGVASSTYPIVANPNGWTIVVDPTGNIGTGQDFSVQATQFSINDNFSRPLDVSGWQGYEVVLRRDAGDNVLRLSPPSLSGSWNPTECPSGQFDYAWFFVGRHNNVDYTTPVQLGPMFDGAPANVNNVSVNYGPNHTYSGIGGVGEGYFFVIITSKANSTCPNKFSCYRKRVAYPVSGVLPLPPGDGGAALRVGDEPAPVVKVLPNPASGSCQVRLSGPVPEAGGRILIYNVAGRQVRALPARAQQSVRLGGLPRGNYRVVLMSGGKPLSKTTLAIE